MVSKGVKILPFWMSAGVIHVAGAVLASVVSLLCIWLVNSLTVIALSPAYLLLTPIETNCGRPNAPGNRMRWLHRVKKSYENMCAPAVLRDIKGDATKTSLSINIFLLRRRPSKFPRNKNNRKKSLIRDVIFHHKNPFAASRHVKKQRT